jgi:hypothetical protein
MKILAGRSLIALTFLLVVSGSAISQDRSNKDPVEWVDSTGKHRVEARFLKLDGNAVVLRRSDGLNMRIPFDRLSQESIDQAKAMASASKSGRSSSGSKGSQSSKSGSSSSGASSSSGSLDNLDAKAFVDLVMAEMEKKNGTIVWDALPSQKQQDIEEVVASFAKRIDSRTFDTVRKIRNTVMEIAKKQQQFILNSTVLPIPPDQKSQIEQSYPAIVGMIDSYLSKDLFDAKRLQKGDLRGLIENWSNGVVASADELAKTLPDGHPIRAQLMDYSGVEYTVETIGSDEANVKLAVPAPDGSTQETVVELILSDGRWLPRQMVEGWEEGLSQAKAAIDQIKGDEVHQMVTGGVLFINAPLQNLKNAKTQEEFDKTLSEIMEMAQGIAMSSMGGPPGAPGAPGGFGPPAACHLLPMPQATVGREALRSRNSSLVRPATTKASLVGLDSY